MIRRALYKYWAAIVFLAVLVEIALAGYGAFHTAGRANDEGEVLTHTQFEDGWEYHSGFGYAMVLAGLILLAIALLGRVGRPRTALALGLVALLVIQVLLARFGADAPVVGALHPINAVAILGLAGLLAHAAWRTSAKTG